MSRGCLTTFFVALLALSASSARAFSPDIRLVAAARNAQGATSIAPLRLHPDEGEALIAAASGYLEAHKAITEEGVVAMGDDDLSPALKGMIRTASGVSAAANGFVGQQESSKKPTESFAFARTLFSRIVPKSKSAAP